MAGQALPGCFFRFRRRENCVERVAQRLDSGRLCLTCSGNAWRASGQTYILRGKTISGRGRGKVESGSAALLAYLCEATAFVFRLSASCESPVAMPTRAKALSEGLDRVLAHRTVMSV